jgi:oxygen-dependent protoporphyrinogen oxidase
LTDASSTSRHVAVIGGGISGLAAAHRLVELDPSVQVTLLEAAPRLGGVLETRHTDGYLLEMSADNFITNVPWALDLCSRIGFSDELIPSRSQNRRALVLKGKQLYPVPEGFLLMAPGKMWPILSTPLLSWPGKLRMLAECCIPRRRTTEDESLASFARRRLGREAFERLVQPLVGGIYTADAERLSLEATLPQFVRMEREHGSLIRAMAREKRARSPGTAVDSGARYSMFMAPREGMSSLIEALARRLPAGTVRLNAPVEHVARVPKPEGRMAWTVTTPGQAAPQEFDALIVSTPAGTTARLLDPIQAGLAEELRKITYASSAVVLLGYAREQIGHPLDGFGFVVPDCEHRQILAGSFSSQKFPGRAADDHALLRIFVGGSARPELVECSDDELKRIVEAEVTELLDIRGEPQLFQVVRWRSAMPQYHLGHLELVDRIDKMVDSIGSLALAGNAYRGVGIPYCIRSGERAAESILASFSSGSASAVHELQ